MEEDSIDGIFNTLRDCASISKWAGGIGLHIHKCSRQRYIYFGNQWYVQWYCPYVKSVQQYSSIRRSKEGGREREFCDVFGPWHGDILEFLELRKNHGDEEMRARDLFYALWIPDLFMRKIEHDEDWYLMCPHICKHLDNVYGEEFETLYESYVSSGQYLKKMKARELWFHILDSQMETGTPYMLYKDACNQKSNQKTLAPSNRRIYVVKLSNIAIKTKVPCVI